MIEYFSLPQLAGTAEGTVTSTAPVNAELLAVYIANNGAGTVTISASTSPTATIMTMDAAGTQWFYPRVATNTAGTAAGTIALSDYTTFPLNSYIQVIQNAAGTVDVTLAIQ